MPLLDLDDLVNDYVMEFESEDGLAFDVLERSKCRALLQSASVGRIGVSMNSLPAILPVNFAVCGDGIIFRTAPGTKLSAATRHRVVAFEVDDYEPNGDVGWSVLVQGLATEVVEPEEIERARALPLRAISPGAILDHFIRIEMEVVSGRRIRPKFQDANEPVSPLSSSLPQR